MKWKRGAESNDLVQKPLPQRLKSVGSIEDEGEAREGVDLGKAQEVKEIIEDYLLPHQKGLHDMLDWITIATVVAAIYTTAPSTCVSALKSMTSSCTQITVATSTTSWRASSMTSSGWM